MPNDISKDIGNDEQNILTRKLLLKASFRLLEPYDWNIQNNCLKPNFFSVI